MILLFWSGTANTRGQRISASIGIGGAAQRTFEVVRAGIDIALGTLPVEHLTRCSEFHVVNNPVRDIYVLLVWCQAGTF